jgi:hypothetical protein
MTVGLGLPVVVVVLGRQAAAVDEAVFAADFARAFVARRPVLIAPDGDR